LLCRPWRALSPCPITFKIWEDPFSNFLYIKLLKFYLRYSVLANGLISIFVSLIQLVGTMHNIYVVVRAGSIYVVVPLFFSLSLALGYWWAEFGQVKVSVLVGRELRGAVVICVGSLMGRSLLIRDRELVFLMQVLFGFLVAPPTYRLLSGGWTWSFDATYHRRLLFWSPLVVVETWLFVDFPQGVLVYFYFFFWCNTWDLISYLYIIYFVNRKYIYIRFRVQTSTTTK